MTSREKVAFQNLKIAIWDECIDEIRVMSLHEPRDVVKDLKHPDDIRSWWFGLTLALMERVKENQDRCRAQIAKVLDTENDLAA